MGLHLGEQSELPQHESQIHWIAALYRDIKYFRIICSSLKWGNQREEEQAQKPESLLYRSAFSITNNFQMFYSL